MDHKSLVVRSDAGAQAAIFQAWVANIHGSRIENDTQIVWSDQDGFNTVISFDSAEHCCFVWNALIKAKRSRETPADASDLDAKNSPRGMSQPHESGKQTTIPSHHRKIKAGNLLPDTDEAAPKAQFGVFGDIVDCRVVRHEHKWNGDRGRHRSTQNVKASGYISFGCSEAALKAVDRAPRYRTGITVGMAVPNDRSRNISPCPDGVVVPSCSGNDDHPSMMPSCQRRRENETACDRQRPCTRCEDASKRFDGCVSTDESSTVGQRSTTDPRNPSSFSAHHKIVTSSLPQAKSQRRKSWLCLILPRARLVAINPNCRYLEAPLRSLLR